MYFDNRLRSVYIRIKFRFGFPNRIWDCDAGMARWRFCNASARLKNKGRKRMDAMMSPIALDEMIVKIHFFGDVSSCSEAPLFVLPYAGDSDDLMEGQHMRIDPVIASDEMPPHVVAVFETKNWNDDLSPWPAPAIRKGEADFAGLAHKTLAWILDRLIPKVESLVPATRRGAKGIFGYSMAGLFALWAMGQTAVFSICASCSGSLWYEGFYEYATENEPLAPCSIYLSLGEGEERTKNKYFSRVGDATRRTAALLEASTMCEKVSLVWHPGGHIGAVGERLAAAHIWMKKVFMETHDRR